MYKSILAVVFGSLLISLGINLFFVSYHLLDGGIIGLGLIFHYLWHFPVGTTIILLSVPIYLLAWVYYRSFFYNSIFGLIISAFFIDLFTSLSSHPTQFAPLNSALFGGILLGLGVGIMFRMNISTGGLDLLAQMFATYFKWNVGVMIFIIDLLVVVAGLYVVSFDAFILSIIAVTATGFATTLVTLDMKDH
ncbi:YitT family protein [Halalkalibacterium ligniniphilum]|uniref:YitT family protein n=1 Tax=Halalkalibacterium ligniniphilum TaxID=1134413 RepID=UPI0003452C4B|nr:YitT family protein [Halalkalibacterium ligniniphilum]